MSTTTQSGFTAHWATGHQRQRPSYQELNAAQSQLKNWYHFRGRVTSGANSFNVRLMARAPAKTSRKNLHWNLTTTEEFDFVAAMLLDDSAIYTWIIPYTLAIDSARVEEGGPHLYVDLRERQRRFKENWAFSVTGNVKDAFDTQMWGKARLYDG